MRLAIFTHVEHIERERQFYAYAPYVREMNLWLNQVEEVDVVAPATQSQKRKVSVQNSYRHGNLIFTRISSFHFLNLKGAASATLKVPKIIYHIVAAMRRADHLHLRCPGNVGLLACVCQIFFPSKPKSAKYAGNWDPEAKQPWTYRLQKWILSNTFLTRNMQVLVYGEWPEQTKNVRSFFTASFSEEEKAEAGEKDFSGFLTFLFVGNLVAGKRPLEAIKLIEELNSRLKEGSAPEIRANLSNARLEIFGNGPKREKLETYVREKHLEQFITFKGSRPLEELKTAYQKAHFVILPSKSEGWPKALAEGMFFGCIPIATPVSCVLWMLGGGSRGILLTEQANDQHLRMSGQWSEDKRQDVVKITQLLADQEEMKRLSEEAKKWSQEYTLEKFEEAIKEILKNEK